MTDPNGNGGKYEPDAFKGKEIEFPVTFQLKAVMLAEAEDAVNKRKLEKVFQDHEVSFSYKNKRKSRKGAYTSYTYQVRLEDKEQMNNLYAGLRKIRELKFAI